MASKLSFKRTTTDKITVKDGLLSEDKLTITYEDENKVEQDVKLLDLFEAFKNQRLDLTIALKYDEDLDIIHSDDDSEDE